MNRRGFGLGLFLFFAALAPSLFAAPPYDLPVLKSAAPNYNRFYTNVAIGTTTVTTDAFRMGDEVRNGVLAYLCPTSPVYNNTAYRDRVLVVMDEIARRWTVTSTADLDEIGYAWQMNYAYLLLKYYRPQELSADRVTAYEVAIARSGDYIVTTSNALLYEQQLLSNLWLNGDIRLAMSVYFGGVALRTSTSLARAEKARRAIDQVMCSAALLDGGQRYVGFWGEVSTYHEENVECFLFWWLITGSTPMKAALDTTRLYTPVAVEPNGFTEQSCNIPYKHMYNNLINRNACLWKAYLYNDGYNYFFGAAAETTTSTEILNTILYQPSRLTKTPPAHVGVFFDGNLQGPRGRFNGTWGWVVNGREVQRGGPESQPLITSQALHGRQCGKDTLIGAFVMDNTLPLVGSTPLKGALTAIAPEIKQTSGAETDLFRGSKYRYLTQDEQTQTITRKNFGTVSSTYRLSTRTSANASANWGSGVPWLGQQVWVLTGERVIGLVQIVSDASSTVFGLDTRMILSAGRRGIMGSYLDLVQPDSATFQFGQLRAKVHATTFTGATTTQRMAISDPNSTDDYSALIRFNDAAVANDAAITYPAGTRRWLVIDVTRQGVAYASEVQNVQPENNNFAVLQFTEGTRKVRVVQNLTATARAYSDTFQVGTTYASTSLHRGWNRTTSALSAANGAVAISETVPAYSQFMVVNSDQADDHTAAQLTSADLFGGVGDLLTHALGAPQLSLGEGDTTFANNVSNRTTITFDRLRADTTYYVEASSDLATWTTIATNPGTLGQTTTVADTQDLTSRRFLRVRVTRP